jgi:Na+-translocating ferredoxin:NAD+ oxidoreductase subunit C
MIATKETITSGSASRRGRLTFPRGIHPPHAKELAEESAIEVLPTPEVVRIPVLQHLGKPSQLCVNPRADVVMGEKIATADGFISTTAHASISGKTAKAGVTTLPNGRHVDTLPIKAAGEQPLAGQALFEALLGGEWPTTGIADIEPKSISDAALEGGIVGQGGAAFPTHVKLLRNEKKPVETLIINGSECEPYLTADYRLMLDATSAVISGTLLAQHACGARRAVICLEDDTPLAAAALRERAAGTGIEVLELKTKYPQGGEKQLTVAVLGKAVPSGGLPLDVGAVVMNVGTTAALARMVFRKIPLTHRIVCVTGAGIMQPKNLLVPIGTPYRDLINFCGGTRPEAVRIVSGGPMMGFAIASLETPVTKGTSGITLLTAEEVRKADEANCVRCGRCVDVCPLNLVPTKIALAARAGRLDIAQKYHMNVCMECGCCAYTCPSSIPLVQLIRVGKAVARSRAS